MRKSTGGTKSAAAADTIAFPADCRIAWISALREPLLESLKTSSVKLDAGAVEKIDTAGVQLLLAFHRDAKDSGCGITWVSISAALRDAVQRLGLTTILALPAVTPA